MFHIPTPISVHDQRPILYSVSIIEIGVVEVLGVHNRHNSQCDPIFYGTNRKRAIDKKHIGKYSLFQDNGIDIVTCKTCQSFNKYCANFDKFCKFYDV